MLQAIELARLPTAPGLAPAPAPRRRRQHRPRGRSRSPPARSRWARRDDRFVAYDNERPRHMVDLPAFRIGRTAITNATFLRFVEGGGYQRREWWSDEGWAWKEEYDITHPQGWAAGPDGWRQWRIDGWAPLHPEEPVVHISWFEADAFARAHGARLPTEAEWEKAATWTQERFTRAPTSTRPGSGPTRSATVRRDPARHARRHLGVDRDRVRRLPRLLAHPYREYSEVFFREGYYVLRGGSWATRPRVATRHVPQLGPPPAAPDLLRREAGMGRVTDVGSAHGHSRAGRAALARGAWAEARASFEAALAEEETAEALEGLSWAAWWLDDVDACFDARERAYRRYRADGDLRGAARMALWLSDDYAEFRRQEAVSGGWFQRAARLLAELPPAPEHGWLAVFEAHVTLAAGDPEGALRSPGRRASSAASSAPSTSRCSRSPPRAWCSSPRARSPTACAGSTRPPPRRWAASSRTCARRAGRAAC